jgi:hypothetical protein
VINRKLANAAIGRDVAEALAEFEIPVLKTTLAQRVLYAESAAQAMAVFEAAPSSDAAVEIRRLVEAIEGSASRRGGSIMKSILFKKPKVVLDANPVDQWVGDGVEHHPEAEPVPEEPMKRFTIDVPAGVASVTAGDVTRPQKAPTFGLFCFSARPNLLLFK